MKLLKGKSWITGEKEKEKAIFLRDTRKPKIVYKKEHQIGTSNKKRDKVRKALPPGKRISKSGNIYWEGRKNRSDLSGEMV